MPNTSIIVKEGPIETVTLDDIKSNKIIYYVIDGWHRVNALRDLADAKLGFKLSAVIYRAETPPKVMLRLALGIKNK